MRLAVLRLNLRELYLIVYEFEIVGRWSLVNLMKLTCNYRLQKWISKLVFRDGRCNLS